MGRAGRATAGVLTVVVLATGLVGCTSDEPGPEGAADALAEALATGDFAKAGLVGATPAEAAAVRDEAFAGLAPWVPTVEAGAVTVDEQDDAAATATFAYTWDVDSGDVDWTYTTHARLERVEGEWQPQWSPALLAPDLVAGETLGVRRERAARADVLGAGGSVLVEDRPVQRIGIDKTRVDAVGQDAAARELAAALEIDADAYAGRVAAAGEKAFVEAIVVRDNDPAYDVSALRTLVGVNVVPDTLPLALTRRFARPLLGSVGQATAEIVEASDGAIAAGDLTGLGGLQKQYDEQLRGRPGLTVVSSNGAADRELFHLDPTPGQPLVLTLDPTLQEAAEQILEPVVPASAIVALRPSTGEVLAAASGPGGEGLSTATVGTYAPGSTFKVVSTLALLRAGLTPTSTLSCPASTTVDGRAFSNYPGYPANRLGDITLRTALANSCNTAFIGARDTVDQQALADAAASLGLGVDAAVGFPAYLGSVPGTATGTEHAASMIGQGKVQASPLAMAVVAASVAQGARVTPRLVVPAEGAATEGAAAEGATATTTATSAAPAAATPAPLTESEAAALRDMMRAFVTEGGGTFLLDVPGPEVLAKSGTAQFGSQDALRNHTWMIAVHGDLAVAVFVEDGDFGTTTSGPLLEAFLRAAA
ncbi:penicillin-binding transpeptidase domain-containing protein [Cellulomonas sp. P22]|uniref:penicillin-binding transpeptidase domain-containing protein n=1 Tax=Cellulomonas sp. P22 TaxID=3373189 RepID=UPI003791E07F